MKLRIASLIVVFSLLLSVLPITALAAADPVELEAIAETKKGQAVTVKGISSFSEVNIKVLRPDGSILYFNIVPVSGGKFTDTITLAETEKAGTYQVVAGQGATVDLITFKVADDTTGTPPQGGGGGGGTSSPGDTTEDWYKVTSGSTTNFVTFDDEKLKAQFTKLAGQGGSPELLVDLSKEAIADTVAELPASVLLEGFIQVSGAIIVIKTAAGSYTLPLSVLDLVSLADRLGTTLDRVTIRISVTKVSEAMSAEIESGLRELGGSLVGDALEFKVIAEGNGRSIELNDFGTTYVKRTIVLPTEVNSDSATGLLYEAATGEFSFVPATFGNENGKKTATLYRNGNSIYAVANVSKSFSDLGNHWAKADIELLASKLIVNGVKEGIFAPDQTITRAEFSALLVRALALPGDAASAAVFTDVKGTAWYAGAVGAAVKAKLANGFDEGTFRPNEPITREQMAVLVSKAILAAGKSSPKTASLAPFSDQAKISTWAKEAVGQSVEAGIVTGTDKGAFEPGANATRAQAAVMLKRLLQHVEFINK
ncbi:S-layer homology domain-containing protein [Paenibacillus sp. PAMC21692]|uniref:S-layer homology domain-containing protein n=1 Tax=Paenibacillus sp. PAMC21692 TaxID=2762320 RepID=UPI00164DCD48|nr:S-layer homology domain-containing protein [Paenibacillus sp. PAMC21692]QNK60218.1 S-layer homology domain-containing protein [Paenibacillus sp. PAMC21692]